MPQLKPKKTTEHEQDYEFDLDESFGFGTSKNEDFELEMDSAKFQGACGQAGTRSK